jgi:hypothetical protein
MLEPESGIPLEETNGSEPTLGANEHSRNDGTSSSDKKDAAADQNSDTLTQAPPISLVNNDVEAGGPYAHPELSRLNRLWEKIGAGVIAILIPVTIVAGRREAHHSPHLKITVGKIVCIVVVAVAAIATGIECGLHHCHRHRTSPPTNSPGGHGTGGQPTSSFTGTGVQPTSSVQPPPSVGATGCTPNFTGGSWSVVNGGLEWGIVNPLETDSLVISQALNGTGNFQFEYNWDPWYAFIIRYVDFFTFSSHLFGSFAAR